MVRKEVVWIVVDPGNLTWLHGQSVALESQAAAGLCAVSLDRNIEPDRQVAHYHHSHLLTIMIIVL